MGWLASFFGWLWLILLLPAGFGLVAVLLDTSSPVSFAWFWTVLLLLMFAALGALGVMSLRKQEATNSPGPARGCTTVWIWVVGWALAMVYLAIGIVWILAGADGTGGWWTLGPIMIAMIVAAATIWLRTSDARSGPDHGTTTSPFFDTLMILGVFILFVGLIGIWLWFSGGRADDGTETVTEGATATTEAVAVPGTETIEDSPVPSSAPEVTTPADENGSEPEVVVATEPEVVEETTPLPEDTVKLLTRWCADAVTEGSAPPSVESVFTEQLDVLSRPAEDTAPPHASNPPRSLTIINLGVAEAGCDGASKLMVLAHLDGPPSEVQQSLALDISEDPGHVADPNASERIAQLGGWDAFLAYDAVNGLFQSDADFAPIDNQSEVDMEGSMFAFIIDRPNDTEMIELTFQTFFRDGDLPSSPTAWQAASMRYEF